VLSIFDFISEARAEILQKILVVFWAMEFPDPYYAHSNFFKI
jgi:hypothetical protein